jgi:hypothetical protein
MLTRSPIRNTLGGRTFRSDKKMRREAPSIALNLSRQVFAVLSFAADAERCALPQFDVASVFCNPLLALAILFLSWN